MLELIAAIACASIVFALQQRRIIASRDDRIGMLEGLISRNLAFVEKRLQGLEELQHAMPSDNFRPKGSPFVAPDKLQHATPPDNFWSGENDV